MDAFKGCLKLLFKAFGLLAQQFQIQDFDRRSSVVAQLRPLIQLSTTIKDNAKMPEIEPCAGGV
jgi:hypothetical protein